jgi:hypothetical protein
MPISCGGGIPSLQGGVRKYSVDIVSEIFSLKAVYQKISSQGHRQYTVILGGGTEVETPEV